MNDLENGMNGAVVAIPAPPKKALDRRDFLTLLNREYDVAMSNLPRPAWEPFSGIKAEMLSALTRLADYDSPGPAEDLVWQKALTCWEQVKTYLDQLIQVSPGVQALRSNQIVAALRGADEWQNKNSKGIVAEQPQGGGKRGKRGGVFSR